MSVLSIHIIDHKRAGKAGIQNLMIRMVPFNKRNYPQA